jgi:toxin ParE1/3/4
VAGLRLVISRSARRDLVDIWRYIAGDSERQADSFADRLYETCELLADNPNLGRSRDDLRAGLNSFPVDRYVIFYRIRSEVLQIVRVLSGYRSIEDLF